MALKPGSEPKTEEGNPEYQRREEKVGRELEAVPPAAAAGIYIPRLCAYKNLIPHGSCRICSVRGNGRI